MRNNYRIQTFIITLALGAFVDCDADTFEVRSLYQHMIEANKAQVVMLEEEGLISAELARQLARGLGEAAEKGGDPEVNAKAYPDYLDLESELTRRIGHEASNIHLGRSRNDLGAAMNRMLMRERTLELVHLITNLRKRVHGMAGEHVETVMPGFTHAVQAQPTTLAHFLLAFDAALDRDCERLQESYARLNRSPLGAAAFTTSGFPLNRDRLAELLGFDGLVENSYDAIMVSTVDSKVELASALSISAIHIGRLAQYLLFQYDSPQPGLLLSASASGRSSIMPQKRNPSSIERLRLVASEVVGKAHTSTLMAHNTPMYEVKDARQDHLMRLEELFHSARIMYRNLDTILRSLTVRTDFLKKAVDDDYSTMTELADTLYRERNVPFRTGYKVASELTTYGREQGKTPSELSFGEVDQEYRKVTGESLPLASDELRKVFDATEFIKGRKGRGGPQPESVNRMLAQQSDRIADLESWIAIRRDRIEDSLTELNQQIQELAR